MVDINDNEPEFQTEDSIFYGAIMEHVPAGSNVIALSQAGFLQTGSALKCIALDKDSGDFGRVSYSIENNSNFTIDSMTGKKLLKFVI